MMEMQLHDTLSFTRIKALVDVERSFEDQLSTSMELVYIIKTSRRRAGLARELIQLRDNIMQFFLCGKNIKNEINISHSAVESCENKIKY